MRQNLRRLRLEKGVSQVYIAKKLGFKYPSGYSNIEMGRNGMSLDQAMVIAEILGVSVDELCEDEHFFQQKLHTKCKPA